MNYIHPTPRGTPGTIEPDSSVAGCKGLCGISLPSADLFFTFLRRADLAVWAKMGSLAFGDAIKGRRIKGRGGSKVAEVQLGRD